MGITKFGNKVFEFPSAIHMLSFEAGRDWEINHEKEIQRRCGTSNQINVREGTEVKAIAAWNSNKQITYRKATK